MKAQENDVVYDSEDSMELKACIKLEGAEHRDLYLHSKLSDQIKLNEYNDVNGIGNDTEDLCLFPGSNDNLIGNSYDEPCILYNPIHQNQEFEDANLKENGYTIARDKDQCTYAIQNITTTDGKGKVQNKHGLTQVQVQRPKKLRKYYRYKKKTTIYGVIPSIYFYSPDSRKHHILLLKHLGTKESKKQFVEQYLKHFDKKITVDTHSHINKTMITVLTKFISEFCKQLGMKSNLLKGHVLSVGSFFENLRVKRLGEAAQIELDFMLQLDYPKMAEINNVNALSILEIPVDRVTFNTSINFDNIDLMSTFRETCKTIWRQQLVAGDIIKVDISPAKLGVKMELKYKNKLVEIDLLPCVSISKNCCKEIMKKMHPYMKDKKGIPENYILKHLVFLSNSSYRLSTSKLETQVINSFTDESKTPLRILKYIWGMVCPDSAQIVSYFLKTLFISTVMTSKNADRQLSCYKCLNYMMIILSKVADNLLNQNRYDSKPDIYQDHFLLRIQVPLVKNINFPHDNHDLIKQTVGIIHDLLQINKSHRNPATYLKNGDKEAQIIFISYLDRLARQKAGLNGQGNRKEA